MFTTIVVTKEKPSVNQYGPRMLASPSIEV